MRGEREFADAVAHSRHGDRLPEVFLTAFTHESAIGYVWKSRLCRTRLASLRANATLPFSNDHSLLKRRLYSASNPSSRPFSSREISNSE